MDAKTETKSESKEEKKEAVMPDIGEAVRIVTIAEDGNKFDMDEEALELVFNNAKKINDKKCVIISVVGAFRTGKSFMLSLFLRYLQWCEVNDTEIPAELPDLEEMPIWLQAGGSRLVEGSHKASESEEHKPGFIWRGGKERTTTGIWMWEKPFVRTMPNGEKVPVVLMDTQGMFDFKTSKSLTAAIFGLSTMISSYQIYNISKQIQEDKLQQLQFFTEFSRVALREFKKAQERQAAARVKNGMDAGLPEGHSEHIHAFQSLDFLVRDWQNFDDEEDVQQCVDSMPEVLETAMTESVDDEGTREQIKGAFDHLTCFLLPHPGTRMTKKNYNGDLTVIDPLFLTLTDLYVRKVFKEKLVTKKLYGQELSPTQLIAYIKAYGDVFKRGKLPKAMNLVQAISATTNLCAKDDCMKKYSEEMTKLTKPHGYVSVDELKGFHRQASRTALDDFDGTATFGDEQLIRQTRSLLKDNMDREYANFVKANDYAMRHGLEKFVIWVLAAVAAFAVDTFTDYTCDAWSDFCTGLSKYLSLYYYLVILYLGYEFFKIYKKSGGTAVGLMGSMLFSQVIEKYDELRAQVMGSAPGVGSVIEHTTANAARNDSEQTDDSTGDMDDDSKPNSSLRQRTKARAE